MKEFNAWMNEWIKNQIESGKNEDRRKMKKEYEVEVEE